MVPLPPAPEAAWLNLLREMTTGNRTHRIGAGGLCCIQVLHPWLLSSGSQKVLTLQEGAAVCG
jgi:hypothetical protein